MAKNKGGDLKGLASSPQGGTGGKPQIPQGGTNEHEWDLQEKCLARIALRAWNSRVLGRRFCEVRRVNVFFCRLDVFGRIVGLAARVVWSELGVAVIGVDFHRRKQRGDFKNRSDVDWS